MMTTSCPLCFSNEIFLIEKISGEKIDRAWSKSFGISTGIGKLIIQYNSCFRCGLRFFDPPCSGASEIYDILQKFHWYYSTSKPEYDMAKRLLPIEGRILEVGSGKGAFASCVGAERYTGLEFSDGALRRAAEGGIRLLKETVESHAASQPEDYDGVVSFQVLEHVADPRGFVQGCVEALKPGGTLVLAVPDQDGLCGIAQNNILDMPPHHVSHWSEQPLRMIAEVFDLELLAIEREAVSTIHQAWAARAVEERKLRRLFGLGDTLLDTSIIGRVLAKVAGLRAGNSAIPEDVSGHTIMASYRKLKCRQTT
ncbi:methyltransferase domain-containing protein [Erythrobacter aquimaris]|uniref:Methyltransferase domain-containing protein n=1 Tax=Qipengyuania aquimaris TaxID=255984 RepID=A0A6I4TIE6_9SPHN|nr:class I SAM-dependent methyltransferase [Qipengyuania aquimaris]MXO95862.1 methyltransferase domain-containing protein [Qipengyuania aquimaris]